MRWLLWICCEEAVCVDHSASVSTHCCRHLLELMTFSVLFSDTKNRRQWPRGIVQSMSTRASLSLGPIMIGNAQVFNLPFSRMWKKSVEHSPPVLESKRCRWRRPIKNADQRTRSNCVHSLAAPLSPARSARRLGAP